MMVLEADVPLPRTPRYIHVELTTNGLRWSLKQ